MKISLNDLVLYFSLKNDKIHKKRGDLMGLILTLVVGLCTLLGSIFVLIFNNNKKIVDFSTGLGFGVLFALILCELLPETFELIGSNFSLPITIIIISLLVIIGIFILKLLDKFIPEHDSSNLIHIGLITSLALFIHNFLEGMIIYLSFDNTIKLGSILGIGVALHNIPLGITIASFSYKQGKGKSIILSLIVSISTFLGGLFAFAFKGLVVNEVVRGIILSITLGMLLYIVLFELLPHIQKQKNKKNSIIAIIIGILVLVLSSFL